MRSPVDALLGVKPRTLAMFALNDCSSKYCGARDQEPAAGGEELFCDENGERRADRATDYSERKAGLGEAIKIGVVAGPGRVFFRAPVPTQSPDDVAVGVEDAASRDGVSFSPFWRRASRSRFSGVKADGSSKSLSARMCGGSSAALI